MTPTDRPEEAVDLAHPLAVAAGEVVVDRHHVDALAGERVEIDRQGRHQGLALTGAHLGDRALVKDHAADELHVEMALTQGALGRLADGGEGRHQDIVQGLAGGELGLELLRAGAELLVRQGLQLGLHRVDGRYLRPIGLQPAIIDRAEDFLRERTEHREPSDTRIPWRKGAFAPPYRLNYARAHLKACARVAQAQASPEGPFKTPRAAML